MKSIFKTILFVALLLKFHFSIAGEVKPWKYEKYDWEENKKQLTPISADEEKEQAVILKDKRATEFIFNAEGAPECYKLIHKTIRVNTEAALEQFNKVYIPMYNVDLFIEIKVRVITSSGKIIILNKDNIKEVENLENAGGYKIFAVEGAEKNCEIEYFYKVKTHIDFFGRETFQNSFKVKNVDFELISPKQLTFKAKNYNGLPSLTVEDTVGKDKNVISISVKEIPALDKEEFANYEANKWRLNYKLAFNGNKKLFKWSEAAENVFEKLYYWKDEKELKPVEKLIKTIGINKNQTELEKVKLIENYLKTNIHITENVGEEGYFIEPIIKNKVASKLGITRLFAAVLTKENIKHKFGLTSDRSEERFDKDFESFDFLSNYVIYFENLNNYIAPSEANYRYPLIPYDWTYNDALFIKVVEIGGMKSALDEIKFIPATPYELSQHNHEIDVNFNSDMDLVNLNVKNIFWGYKAIYIQPYISSMKEEQKKDVMEQTLKSSAEDAKVLECKMLNTDINVSATEKPFTIEGKMSSSSLLEKAGNKYLFKVGDLIGRQAEMYQEKKRVQPIENDFNRRYYRIIKITIPEGYQIKNLDNLKMDFKDASHTMQFVSTYKIEGNILTINIDEYYKQISYPIEQIEPYRKVINAAADFNKIKLVFEKK